MLKLNPRFHCQATWLLTSTDDIGNTYVEAQTFDLVLSKPKLLNSITPSYATHLVRATVLHRYLDRLGWILASVNYTQNQENFYDYST